MKMNLSRIKDALVSVFRDTDVSSEEVFQNLEREQREQRRTGLTPAPQIALIMWCLCAVVMEEAARHSLREKGMAVPDRWDVENGHVARSNTDNQHASMPQASVEPVKHITVTDTVPGFAFNSDALTPQMKERLENIFNKIKTDPTFDGHIDVIGHTDSLGTTEYNNALALHRGEQAAYFLSTLNNKKSSISHYFVGLQRQQPIEVCPAGIGERGQKGRLDENRSILVSHGHTL
jgi:outer membrane protein OmpA-like peptidoglycan-associated protein